TVAEASHVTTGSQAFALGNAGNITVNASETVQISSGSLVESSSILGSKGNAGTISITAPTVMVADGGIISTSTMAAGTAGSIMVNAASVSLAGGGQFTSSSLAGGGKLPPPTGAAGAISIQGQTGAGSRANSVVIDGAGSGIFTTTQGQGAGGDINLASQSVALQNGGTLSAKTSGTAPSAAGGNITITAGQFV